MLSFLKFTTFNCFLHSLISKINSYIYFIFWATCHQKLIKDIRYSWNASHSSTINTIVFSKDRAMQLHALLSSFFDTKIGECGIIVIYTASTNEHRASYEDLVKIFGSRVKFVEHKNSSDFKNCLKLEVEYLPKGKLFFLVDDIIITEVIDYNLLSSLSLKNIIFSLRMGDHLNYSYVVGVNQPLPMSLKIEDNLLTWQWSKCLLEWGYPLSVDGHIFNSDEVLLWIQNFEFSSPSSFENSLQIMNHIYNKKQGVSFKKSRLFNIPANKVQNEVANLHGNIHQDNLLRYWNDGLAIDHSKMRGWNNYSVHEEIEFHYVKRS